MILKESLHIDAIIRGDLLCYLQERGADDVSSWDYHIDCHEVVLDNRAQAEADRLNAVQNRQGKSGSTCYYVEQAVNCDLYIAAESLDVSRCLEEHAFGKRAMAFVCLEDPSGLVAGNPSELIRSGDMEGATKLLRNHVRTFLVVLWDHRLGGDLLSREMDVHLGVAPGKDVYYYITHPTIVYRTEPRDVVKIKWDASK